MQEFQVAMGQAQAAGGQAGSVEDLRAEVAEETKAHKILVYGKGTKAQPMCGFTVETMQFFDQFGYPYEVVNVLDNPAKREILSQMTDWPTLPKVFIGGTFYGDTDILGPMHEKGDLAPLLARTFESTP